MRVRIDGRKGGLIESEAFWIHVNKETEMPSRISDDFLDGLHQTTSVDRLRWKGYLKPGGRDDRERRKSTSSRSESPTSTCSTT